MIRGFMAAALSLAFLGCVGVPPGVDPTLVERPSEMRALEDELEKSPNDIRLYQKLIDFDLRGHDFANAKATAYQCVDANPSNWEAWMLAAQVHRTLLSLRETQEALEKAVKLAPKSNDLAKQALASYFTEIGRHDEAFELHRDLYHGDKSLPHRVAYLEASIRAGKGLPKDLGEIEKGDTPTLQISLLLSRPTSTLQDWDFPSFANPGKSDYATALRLVSLLGSSGELESFFVEGLKREESPNVRFACYFGQWELAVLNNQARSIKGFSADAIRLAQKLDQIDDKHPMWLARRWQVASALGDVTEEAATRKKLNALGVSPGEAAPSLESALAMWQVEDASRLGLLEVALSALDALPSELSSDPRIALQRLHLLRESGKTEEAQLLLTKSLAKEDASDQLRFESFLLRIQNGQAVQVKAEIVEMAKAGKALRLPMASLAWLRAMIDYWSETNSD